MAFLVVMFRTFTYAIKTLKTLKTVEKKSIIKHCVDLCLSRPIYRNVLVGALLRSYLVLSVYIHDSSIYKKL